MKAKLLKKLLLVPITVTPVLVTANSCSKQKTNNEFKFDATMQRQANLLWQVFGLYSVNHEEGRYDTSGSAFAKFFSNDKTAIATVLATLSQPINDAITDNINKLNFDKWPAAAAYNNDTFKTKIKNAYQSNIDMLLMLLLLTNCIYVSDYTATQAAIKRINNNLANIDPTKTVLEWLLNLMNNDSTSFTFISDGQTLSFDSTIATKYYAFVKTLFASNSANKDENFTKLLQSNFLPGSFVPSSEFISVPTLSTTATKATLDYTINKINLSTTFDLQFVSSPASLNVTKLLFTNLFA